MPEMSEDEAERAAWEIENKIMAIRKDPRAALFAGLARVRDIMCAEVKVEMAKIQAAMEVRMVERWAKIEAELVKREAKREAELKAEFAGLMSDLRATRADLARLRAGETAEPDPPQPLQ